ncbi:sugar ABC transporter ATP-binding protein [Ruixingdingia sedimenti]|uniref:Sugar ABC transporter ATP-binding protein n=1 Tax=Ruixingdingia sedimenti TaxID=3073604 RepID=A0ABU1F8X6_9RHOB|nr:sugar ABC transporter ATP-binding protein [Xinfangfangia sp. LG-4]MDR5653302.1 sugar ABC transporter ATP-binding protein [Xinfangfangia sp. LG-4]
MNIQAPTPATPAAATTPAPGSEFLIMRGVTKEFHGVPALKSVDFTLRKGEVHALLGENGAGKSTLTKLLAGAMQPTSGEIEIDGRLVEIPSPVAARDLGVAMVFQETSLVPSMTVAQNLFLGDEKGFNRLRPLYVEAQVFFSSLNFDVDPWAQVATLGAAKKQMIEIARAVRQNARVIIFDEPTATLTPEEKQHFFALVRRLRGAGVSIIFISHALEEALDVADRITILRDGELVVTDDAASFDRDRIVAAMVGRQLSEEIHGAHGRAQARKRGPVVLSVENLSMGKAVRNTSFTVARGQITGIFGLIGSGRTETAKVIAGILKRDFFYGGEILLEGRPIRYRVPRQAVRDGIIYVTEDRKLEGFFDTMSIGENLLIAHLAAARHAVPILRMGEARQLYEVWQKQLSIRALNDEVKVIELSGGNQQKVVIAKALLQRPKLIIFDEPTRGVDVGAIAEIHQLINRLADDGMAVVVISSYLPEIINLSDRILVTQAGRVAAEFDAGASEKEIMFAAVH